MSIELVSLRYELQFQLESVTRTVEKVRVEEESTEWLEGVARGLEVAISFIDEKKEESNAYRTNR